MSVAALQEEVHIWYTFTADPATHGRASDYLSVLDEAERARQGRFLRSSDRHQFLVAHVLKRLTLSRYAGCAPSDWGFQLNRYGCPAVASPARARWLRFNISHTEGLVACAVTADRDIGVDVEHTGRRVDIPRLAPEVFTEAELLALRSLSAEQQRERFFLLWTLKEAYIKARGMGLSLPLQKFHFEVSDSCIHLHTDAALADPPEPWELFSTPLGPCHRLSAMTRSGVGELRFRLFGTVPQVVPSDPDR